MALHVVRRINRQVAPSAKLFYITSPGVVPVFLLKVLTDNARPKFIRGARWGEGELKLGAGTSFAVLRFAVHCLARTENRSFSIGGGWNFTELHGRRQRQSTRSTGLCTHQPLAPVILPSPAARHGTGSLARLILGGADMTRIRHARRALYQFSY